MNDPRFGLPSASAATRWLACPASHHMEQQIPQPPSSEEASSGTRIHAVLALESTADTLNSAEIETMEMCLRDCERVTQDWNGTGDSTQPQMVSPEFVIREQRLGLTSLGTVVDVGEGCKASLVCTGQPDLVLVKKGRAVVVDYKTGRGDTEVAENNTQLAVLAVLVSLRYKVRHVRVAIVQPWAGKPTVCDYTPESLDLATSWLLAGIAAVDKATPDDAKAGDHCKWCRAKAVCPALREAAIVPVSSMTLDIAALDGKEQRAALFAKAMALPAEQHVALWRGLKLIERYVESVADAFKSRVEAGNIPGFGIREKEGRRKVTDVQKVAARCFEHGVTVEDFTAECTITLGSVESLVAAVTNAKGKQLKQLVGEVLIGACETGTPMKEVVEL